MTARKPSPTPCALPIASTQLARGLIRLHSRLRGELVKRGTSEAPMVAAEAAHEAMAHIKGVLDFLGINFVPEALKPIRTREQIGPLGYGDLRAGILAVLRSAGDWLTYEEIAQAVIARAQLTLTAQQYRHFLQMLREAAHALKAKGAVERENDITPGDQAQQRLRLSRALFRPR
jgi:hypothetical protein